MKLQELPFRKAVEDLGGKIFSVGGAVRDKFLNITSKDLDILVTGIPFTELELLLSKFGQVNAVGESFGILKFKVDGETEDIDVAIPRTEVPTGEGGHKGFEVVSSHDLPIEKDLERRDFTINAIAEDIDGNIIDPFNGKEDIFSKLIRVVNPDAFSDDPLRMLRAVQFAARLGFTIEDGTREMIKENAHRIKEIPAERILIEFDKIVNKGNAGIGAFLLHDLGLSEHIFGTEVTFIGNVLWDNVQTMGEFIWLLSRDVVDNPADFFKNELKGDLVSFNEIKALDLVSTFDIGDDVVKNRLIANKIHQISPQILKSGLLPNELVRDARGLLDGNFPKTVNELDINGHDLMEIGLVGKEISDAQKILLEKVYSNELKNNKVDLLAFLMNTQNQENGENII